MKKFLLFFLFITLSGCGDGVLMNKHIKRSNGPIDGPTGDGSFSHKRAVYVEGNLEYLSDYKKRDNSLYFNSVRKNNKSNHQVAENYIREYQKLLRIDTDELEDIIKSDQSDKNGARMFRKMEAGKLERYPITENIKAIQYLKYEKDKMAFPEYMDEYFDLREESSDDDIGYIAELDNGDAKEKIELQQKVEDKFLTRDEYVDFYFREMSVARSSNLERYKEEPLLKNS